MSMGPQEKWSSEVDLGSILTCLSSPVGLFVGSVEGVWSGDWSGGCRVWHPSLEDGMCKCPEALEDKGCSEWPQEHSIFEELTAMAGCWRRWALEGRWEQRSSKTSNVMQKKFIRFCLGGTKEPVNNFEQCTDNFLKIEVQLIYNVVLVAGVQQSDSLYICIHTHPHTYTFFSFLDSFPI